MTISIHPARQVNEEVPPGTWEGTKQDAVLATAQLLEVLSRKKAGEKAPFGFSEYDAQMANAQLRAFKLTKVIMRKARRNSLPDAPVTIEEMGFPTESDTKQTDPKHVPKPPSSPPTCALPTPPKQSHSKTTARSKSSSPPTRKVKPSASVPITKFPPPIPPRKSSNRLCVTPAWRTIGNIWLCRRSSAWRSAAAEIILSARPKNSIFPKWPGRSRLR